MNMILNPEVMVKEDPLAKPYCRIQPALHGQSGLTEENRPEQYWKYFRILISLKLQNFYCLHTNIKLLMRIISDAGPCVSCKK